MAEYLIIHPDNPQPRFIKQAAKQIAQGAVVAFPTDSCYALGCHLGDKEALNRIRRIRALDKRHHFTLICRDLSEVGTFAQISNRAYRLLRAHTPGAYTFILAASREVPKRLHNPKRKTIGLRVPDNTIVNSLLTELQQPLLSVTLILPHQTQPLTDAETIITLLEHQIDLIIDGGHCGTEPTTVVDLETAIPNVLRYGKGDPSPFI